MPRQREWEWQWDKLRLFYERLVSEDEGALVDGGVEGLEEVGLQWVDEVLGGLRRWVEAWVEVGHRHRNTVVITMADELSCFCCIID